MNTILFTFYAFDIFQAKRFKTTYQWNGMDLREAEDTTKRWQEYTDELYNKDLNDIENHDGVITDLQPDILECKVKWALGSITMNIANISDGIPADSSPKRWGC